MGWLFRKKKIVPKVPFPKGETFDEKELRLPEKVPTGDFIKSDRIKKAVEFDKPLPLKEEQLDNLKIKPLGMVPPKPEGLAPLKKNLPSLARFREKDEIFVKINDYQKVLGEIDYLKKDLSLIGSVQRKLETSEYNEDENFNKLKKIIKGLHDSLLEIDKTLFNN